VFGDGRHGARLPSGVENVKAAYRSGIGSPGNVRAGQLTLLATRPLGVREVENPLRASGGADRETRDLARTNAPLAVMALDRLVSTRDYADFARGFAGIAKARAVELSDGRRSVVHVTVAGAQDVPIETGSELFLNLRRALVKLGDPLQPVAIATRELLMLLISARVRKHPDHRWERVATDLRAKLFEHFGFERRELVEDVTASEVLSVMQSVRGVVYVDLEGFGAVPTRKADSTAAAGQRPLTPREIAKAIDEIVKRKTASRVIAEPARLPSRESGASSILPAQLAILLPAVPETLILNAIEDA
jgi:predicted phage baseplate assembly protein